MDLWKIFLFSYSQFLVLFVLTSWYILYVRYAVQIEASRPCAHQRNHTQSQPDWEMAGSVYSRYVRTCMAFLLPSTVEHCWVSVFSSFHPSWWISDDEFVSMMVLTAFSIWSHVYVTNYIILKKPVLVDRAIILSLQSPYIHIKSWIHSTLSSLLSFLPLNCDTFTTLLSLSGVVLPTPVGRCRYWHRSLNPKKLVEVCAAYTVMTISLLWQILCFKRVLIYFEWYGDICLQLFFNDDWFNMKIFHNFASNIILSLHAHMHTYVRVYR